MARKSKLWINSKERWTGAALKRAVPVLAMQLESIRTYCPLGCGSFWLKEEYSSLGVSLRYASVQKFFFRYQKSSATRQM